MELEKHPSPFFFPRTWDDEQLNYRKTSKVMIGALPQEPNAFKGKLERICLSRMHLTIINIYEMYLSLYLTSLSQLTALLTQIQKLYQIYHCTVLYFPEVYISCSFLFIFLPVIITELVICCIFLEEFYLFLNKQDGNSGAIIIT